MALRWQDVHAQNQSDAANFAKLGSQQLQQGISGIGNLINNIGQQEQAEFNKRKAANTEQLLGQIAATQGEDEAMALRDQFTMDSLRGQYGDAIDANAILGAAGSRYKDVRAFNQAEDAYAKAEARKGFDSRLKYAFTDLATETDPTAKKQMVDTLVQDIMSNPSGTMADVEKVFGLAGLSQQVANTEQETISVEDQKQRASTIIDYENKLNTLNNELGSLAQSPYSAANAAKTDQTTHAQFSEWVNSNAPDTDINDSSDLDEDNYIGGEDLKKFGSNIINNTFKIGDDGKPVVAKDKDKGSFRIKPHHILNASKALVTKGGGVSSYFEGDAEVKADELLKLAAQMATEEIAQREGVQGKERELKESTTFLRNELNKLNKLK